MKPKVGWRATLRKKLSRKDAHYSGGLVAGAKILEFFGDAATALCLRETRGSNEGLFRAYESVEFLKPVYAGDVVTVTATVTRIGHTSRGMSFVATKAGSKREVVCRAKGTVVIASVSEAISRGTREMAVLRSP